MTFNKIFRLCASVAAIIIAQNVAFAATQTSNMAVTATVNATCTISAGPLAFGVYTGAQLDATSTITVTCTNGAPYTIDLNAGAGAGATTAIRKLTSGANLLDYSIYTDIARATVWAVGGGSGTGNGSAQTITAYGRMPAQVNPTVGSYADTVVATLNY